MELVVPGAANLSLFVVAALALLLVPGPAVLYIVARSVEQGRLAGFVSDLGIHYGDARPCAGGRARAVGAARRRRRWPSRSSNMSGAAYLIWLGLQEDVRARRLAGRASSPLPRHELPDGCFATASSSTCSIPKTALFFLAFLPQFVDVSRGHVAMQIAFLGLLFAGHGIDYRRLLRPSPPALPATGSSATASISGSSAMSAAPCSSDSG